MFYNIFYILEMTWFLLLCANRIRLMSTVMRCRIEVLEVAGKRFSLSFFHTLIEPEPRPGMEGKPHRSFRIFRGIILSTMKLKKKMSECVWVWRIKRENAVGAM